MKTRYKEQKEIQEIVTCIANGGVVAFPTDTVYGLGVVFDCPIALEKLKASKGRPDNKPIPMMIGSLEQLRHVAEVNEQIERLIQAFMPGGFTLILKRKDTVKDYVTNGFDTIACRMPDDTFILNMIQQVGKPLLVTSANISGAPTGITTEEVIRDFDGKIDMIVSGECKGLLSSTIVNVSDGNCTIVRQGPVSETEIFAVWNNTNER